MQILKYIRPEVIRLGMMSGHVDTIDPEKNEAKERVRLKEAVIEELTDVFMTTGQVRNRNKFHHDLLSRERKATTAIGGGLALPHVRSMQPKQFCMILVRSRDGVEYASPDEEPVHLFFGMAAPTYDEKMSAEYLQVYKWIARAFKEEDWLMNALMQAETENDIMGILSGLD